jgi:hypothetical protein
MKLRERADLLKVTSRSLRSPWWQTGWTIAIVAAALIGVAVLSGQNAGPAPPAAPAPQQNTQAAPSVLVPVAVDGSSALHHLNRIISWYRHATTGIHSVGLPSDAIYQDNAQSLGAEAIRLAFESAKAESALIKGQQKAGSENANGGQASQQQNLAQMQASTTALVNQLQSQIEKLNAQIARTSGARRATLSSQRDTLESELELQKARLDAYQKMASFMETNGELAGGLEGSINQLAKSIPEVLGTSAPQKAAPTSAAAAPAKPSIANSGGLISQALTLYDYVNAVHSIDQVISETDDIKDAADQLRSPLRDALRATIKQSQQLAGQPTASTNPAQLAAEQQGFKELTTRFKQLTDTLIPLSQEIIVLNDSKTNLDEWRSSIARESKYVLRSVLVRVIGIVLALVVILVLSEIWRRVTFRYIADPRRRRQFLVMRRVVIGFLVGIVLILGFISQFSSLATFAGFITAGIAVGLQAVLLSVAAYFFIIGRYGIRVGDRISVAGITGDVIDIGLVRLYLTELAGTGLDFYPTGRIVVFSNAVLFQTGTPLFKQIPGTEYAWHEVAMLITPNGNYKEAQEKLVAAVNSVYAQYKDEIERQHEAVERRVDFQIAVPRPEARLQFVDAGLELLVRYPVEIRTAPDIDEEMTRKVLELIDTDATLKAAVSGTPKIRSAIKG